MKPGLSSLCHAPFARHLAPCDVAWRMRWILTRDAADNAAILRHGVDGVSVPCVEQVALPWPEWAGDIIMLTSRRAALGLPTSMRAKIACLSSATAQAVRDAGREPWLVADGGVVGLAKAVIAAAAEGASVLYAHSSLASGQCEHQQAKDLLCAHVKLSTHVVYDIRPPEHLQATLRGLPKGDYALLVASPSALTHLHQAGVPRHVCITHIAGLGGSTARAVPESMQQIPYITLRVGDDLALQLQALEDALPTTPSKDQAAT